jgi:hypothetical protein
MARGSSPAQVSQDELFGYVDFLAQGGPGDDEFMQGAPQLPVAPEATVDPIVEAQTFRAELLGFQDLQKDKLDPYAAALYGNDMPHNKPRRGSWSEWLAEDASDAQVADFLHRSAADRAEQQANPYVSEYYEHYRGAYIDRLRDGMAEGWISPYAQNKLHRLSTARLQIGDIRTTHLAWKAAEYRGPSNTVVIGQGIGPDQQSRVAHITDNIYHSLPHELSHIFGRWLPRWASEGFAEQMNMAIREGNPLVFHPQGRVDAQNPYAAAERTLLHTLFYESPAGTEAGARAAQLFLRAATSRNGESAEWREFSATLDRMWGRAGMFERVTSRIDAEEIATADEHRDWVSFQVESEAATRVSSDLAEYGQSQRMQKPQPHVGAAAMSGAGGGKHARRR